MARRAHRFGVTPAAAASLLLWALGFGLLGAHLFTLLARHPERLRADPLALLRFWQEPSALGGLLGGLLGLYAVMRAKHMPTSERLRFLDCLFYALPFTLVVADLARALRHDQLGIATGHWLAVRFPDGVSRLDLGLLELLYVTLLAGLFVWLGRRSWPSGFFVGLFLALYGPARFALDALRIVETRYFGWTPGQYVALAAAVAGMAILTATLRRQKTAPGG